MKLGLLSTIILSSLCVACSSESSLETNATATTTTNTATQTAGQLSTTVTGLSAEDFFSNRDYRTEMDSDSPVTITFSGSSIQVEGEGVTVSGTTATITQEGTYVLQGTLEDGAVVVEMADETHKAQLFLDNVTLNSSTAAPIQVISADKVFITTAEGSENHISATIGEEETADGGIFAKADLTLNGLGSLSLEVTNGDGVVAKDELTITSGSYQIMADGHGLNANDGIAIADGSFLITAEKDGFHSEHSSNLEKGNIFVLNGNFTLDVQGDGLDAGGFLEIQDGIFDITTCGGSENAPVKVASSNNMGGGRNEMTGGMTNQMQGGQEMMGGMSPEMMDPNQMQGGREEMMGGMSPEMMDPNQMQGGQEMTGGMSPEMMDPNQMQGGREEMMGGMSSEMMDPNQMQGGREEMMGGMSPEMMDPNQMQGGQEMMGGMSNQMQGGRPEMTEPLPEGTLVTPNIVVDGEEDPDAVSTKGLKSGGEMRLYGGIFVLDCYDDSLHSDTNLTLYDGQYTLSTGDDGIHANWNTTIAGGTIDILTCFEGIEGQQVNISGGIIDLYAGDDGINAATTSPNPDDSTVSLVISGGTIIMDSNAEGDGLDSNGSILITGGDILVSSTTDQRDTALDSSGTSIITGGSFLATGSNSATIQNFEADSTQPSILVQLSAMQEGRVTLTHSDGTVLVDFTPVKEYQAVTLSTPDLVVGETYTLTMGETTETITLDTLIYGSGNGGGMMGGRR